MYYWCVWGKYTPLWQGVSLTCLRKMHPTLARCIIGASERTQHCDIWAEFFRNRLVSLQAQGVTLRIKCLPGNCERTPWPEWHMFIMSAWEKQTWVGPWDSLAGPPNLMAKLQTREDCVFKIKWMLSEEASHLRVSSALYMHMCAHTHPHVNPMSTSGVSGPYNMLVLTFWDSIIKSCYPLKMSPAATNLLVWNISRQ